MRSASEAVWVVVAQVPEQEGVPQEQDDSRPMAESFTAVTASSSSHANLTLRGVLQLLRVRPKLRARARLLIAASAANGDGAEQSSAQSAPIAHRTRDRGVFGEPQLSTSAAANGEIVKAWGPGPRPASTSASTAQLS